MKHGPMKIEKSMLPCLDESDGGRGGRWTGRLRRQDVAGTEQYLEYSPGYVEYCMPKLLSLNTSKHAANKISNPKHPYC